MTTKRGRHCEERSDEAISFRSANGSSEYSGGFSQMRFGLILPSFSFPDLDYAKAARLRDFAVRAEALGYDALWVVEHLLTARGLYGTAWLSPLETLSFAAGCTSRIKLATGILIAALRNPVFTAKDIASLQYLSGGRFELGIGVGWDAHEYDVAGVPLRQRGGRTDEILEIFARLWTGEPVTYHGRYYHFDDVVIDPEGRGIRNAVVWLCPESGDPRAAFPKDKTDLIARQNGPQMFQVARKALEDLAQHIASYRGAAAMGSGSAAGRLATFRITRRDCARYSDETFLEHRVEFILDARNIRSINA